MKLESSTVSLPFSGRYKSPKIIRISMGQPAPVRAFNLFGWFLMRIYDDGILQLEFHHWILSCRFAYENVFSRYEFQPRSSTYELRTRGGEKEREIQKTACSHNVKYTWLKMITQNWEFEGCLVNKCAPKEEHRPEERAQTNMYVSIWSEIKAYLMK